MKTTEFPDFGKFKVKGCKDFGYIIDAFHLLKEPRRPLWHRVVDAVLAFIVFFGWYGGIVYILYRIFHG
jgi:hypothetical protein